MSLYRILSLVILLLSVWSIRSNASLHSQSTPRFSFGDKGFVEFAMGGSSSNYVFYSIEKDQIKVKPIDLPVGDRKTVFRLQKLSKYRAAFVEQVSPEPRIFILKIPSLEIQQVKFPKELFPNLTPENVHIRSQDRMFVTGSGEDDLMILFGGSFVKYSLSSETASIVKWENPENLLSKDLTEYTFFGELKDGKAFLWGHENGILLWNGVKWIKISLGLNEENKRNNYWDYREVLEVSDKIFASYYFDSAAQEYKLFSIPLEELAKINEDTVLQGNEKLQSYMVESVPRNVRGFQGIEFSSDERCLILVDSFQRSLAVYDRHNKRWAGQAIPLPRSDSPELLSNINLVGSTLYLSEFDASTVKRGWQILGGVIKNKVEVHCPGQYPIDKITYFLNGDKPNKYSMKYLNKQNASSVFPKQNGENPVESWRFSDFAKIDVLLALIFSFMVFYLYSILEKWLDRKVDENLKNEDDENGDVNDWRDSTVNSVFEEEASVLESSDVQKSKIDRKNERRQFILFFAYLTYVISVMFLGDSSILWKRFSSQLTEKIHENINSLGLSFLVIEIFFVCSYLYISKSKFKLATLFIPLILGLSWSSASHDTVWGGIVCLNFGIIVLILTKIVESLWKLSSGSLILRIGILILVPGLCVIPEVISASLSPEENFELNTKIIRNGACNLFESNSNYYSDCNLFFALSDFKDCRDITNEGDEKLCAAYKASMKESANQCLGINSPKMASYCVVQFSALNRSACDDLKTNFEMNSSWSADKKNSTSVAAEICEQIRKDDYPCDRIDDDFFPRSLCQSIRAVQKKDVNLCPKDWLGYISCLREINLLVKDRPRLKVDANPYVNEPFCEEFAKSPVCLARLSAISQDDKYCDILTDNKLKASCYYLAILSQDISKISPSISRITDQCQAIEKFVPELKNQCVRNIKHVYGL